MKLYEKNTDAIIKYEEHCILVFEYIGKNFNGFRCNLNKYRDV